MPLKEFDEIERLFMKVGDGEYVPLMEVKELDEIREEKPFTAEMLQQAAQELKDRIREAQGPDTILMNDETMMMLMVNGYIREEAKEFRYCGLRVITSMYLPADQIYLTTAEYAEEVLEAFAPRRKAAKEPEGKKPPRLYHCRVCWTVYDDKRQARECVRSHEWQNRRGRR